ncbi:MAG: DNA-protecting protein DprA [bacterium]|nr:DNA-protecting protein DprA [Candidatus Kapabacteria bacterium]
MLTTQQVLTLWLCTNENTQAVRRLVESGATYEQIVVMRRNDLAHIGLPYAAINALSDVERAVERCDSQFALAAAYDARVVSLWDDGYPPLLREAFNAPAVLFMQGTCESSDVDPIAIVGTRGATTYGRLAAERYGHECASVGVTVVSGLARGIDTCAHLAALEAGGRTFAVVASGLDMISPSSAARLSERIIHNGCVMSEKPFGVRALAAFFPQRNRIISGIAKGIIVIESDVEGGAMITANFASDQNREVFALPGPTTSPKSRGTNLLVRTDRARLTQTPTDVLVGLNYIAADTNGTMARFNIAQLSMFEQQIIEALGEEPLHIDELSEATGITTSEMLVNLLQLEFKGLARQMAGKMFLRTLSAPKR